MIDQRDSSRAVTNPCCDCKYGDTGGLFPRCARRAGEVEGYSITTGKPVRRASVDCVGERYSGACGGEGRYFAPSLKRRLLDWVRFFYGR